MALVLVIVVVLDLPSQIAAQYDRVQMIMGQKIDGGVRLMQHEAQQRPA